MKKRLLCVLLTVFVLAGCEKQPEALEFTTFAMDTVMSFTFYSQDKEKTASNYGGMIDELSGLERALSVTREDSAIARLNRSEGQPVELDSETVRLLDQALELCAVTGGALDITAYPAVKAWGFTTGEHRVPGQDELAELAANIDYTAVKLAGNTVTLPVGMEIDLGAVAKGFAGDQLAERARSDGITSALLNLGQSTIVTIGGKPGDKPWRVALQDPAGEGSLGVLELEDMAMGTSGGYQRFFEEDGEIYWHILDPAAAAPARSGLGSATVVASSALTCDGLSTALFVMGLEEGTRFWRDHPELEFEAIFVTEEGGIYCTAGLADCFTPMDETLEVTILE